MPSAEPSLTAVREMVERFDPPGTPLTASELAANFDCSDRAVSDRLETLVDEGILETKDVGARGRVWWRPVDTPLSSPNTPRGTNDTVGSADTAATWFRADGEMAERVREFPWAETSLGPISDWPPELRVAVDVMLGAAEAIGVYWGADLTLLYNDAWRGLIGEKHPDALGQPAKRVFPELWDTIGSQLTAVLNGEGAVVRRAQLLPLEREGRREDAWFDYSVNPIPVSGGSVGGILNIAVEVTERREIQQALRESEERLHLATEIGGIGIWELDLRTRDSPVRTARHDEIFGYRQPIDDWSLGRFLDHVVPEHRDRVERSLEEGLRTGLWAFECRIVRVDDQQRWIAARGRIFDDESGEPRRALGVVQDITDRKRRERELERQRERLERQNERLEEFTSTVTHDLRSPLSVIGGRLRLYRETGEAEHLDTAEETLERAGRLVDDLLTVAPQGRLVETTDPTDVEAVFEQARDGTLPDTAEWEYQPVPTILADRDRLLQLFENVLRNSAEHGGDDVTVRVGPLPDRAGFYIEDDGPGFAGVDPDRVFEFGYSGREEGTGFGLSIVQSIADAHGWAVSMDTEASDGARFELTDVVFAADA